MCLEDCGVEEMGRMRIYTLEAWDEFGRKYAYTHACTELEFGFNENWIYQYWMTHMVRSVLKRMGEDAKATWFCREDIYE